jgi:hypothetical protein
MRYAQLQEQGLPVEVTTLDNVIALRPLKTAGEEHQRQSHDQLSYMCAIVGADSDPDARREPDRAAAPHPTLHLRCTCEAELNPPMLCSRSAGCAGSDWNRASSLRP